MSDVLQEKKRLTFWRLSVTASLACLIIFLKVPDWRLIWLRWNRHDFCALPGHSALRWGFARMAFFAFVSPVFAYLGFRLARGMSSNIISLILFFVEVLLVLLVIHGLFWPTDWK